MREIILRAFHKEEKVFYYSDEGSGGWWGDCVLDMSEDFEPLQQYIGKKDENGVRIFEGDIIKGLFGLNIKVGYRIMTVIWNNPASAFHARGDMNYSIYTPGTKVIGNIYENPELLK